MTGTVAANVTDRAHLYGAFGSVDGAYYENAETMVFPAMMGSVKATYSGRMLTIHGMTGDLGPAAIRARSATVHGMTGDLTFEFNERCSDRQAALGVMSIIVATSK